MQIYPLCAQESLVKFCLSKNVIPVAYSPIGRVGASYGPMPSQSLPEHELIIQMAEKYGKNPVQILLNWGMQRGYIVIPKSSSVEH